MHKEHLILNQKTYKPLKLAWNRTLVRWNCTRNCMNERFKEKNLNTSVLTVLLKTGRQPQRTRPSRGYSYISMARPRPENVECEDGVIAASVAASGDKARDLESGQHEIKTEHCHGDSKEKLEGKTCMGESLFDHPVYKTISKVNGVINRMHKEELVTKLGELNLNSRGTKEVLQKRLKGWVRFHHLHEAKLEERLKPKWFTDYYVVIDFEATCEEHNPAGFIHEIIEFPAVLVNTRTLRVENEFHSYCRPKINPVLTPFCRRLTGIQQYKVDSAPEFPTVLKRFDQWLKQELTSIDRFAIVTDGSNPEKWQSKRTDLDKN